MFSLELIYISSRHIGESFAKEIFAKFEILQLATLRTPKILFSESQEKAVCFQLCITENSEIKPRKMTTWELGCFFAKGKGLWMCIFKNRLVFLLAFRFFSSAPNWELRIILGFKTFLCGFCLSLKSTQKSSQAASANTRGLGPLFWGLAFPV